MDDVIKILDQLLRFKTITPNECGSFDYITSLLPDYNKVLIEKNGIKNLILSKKFNDAKNHLCISAHIDVVLADNNWNSDPFEPVIKDGFIYGRGAQDMKGNIAPMICALRDIKDFNGKISFIITSDEEGTGEFGTQEALKFLKSNNDLPNYALIIEPTSNKILGDNIKIGRRGSIHGVLKIFGVSGHVAYPNNCINPVDILSKYLNKISSHNLDSGDENYEASKIIITGINAGLKTSNVTPPDLTLNFNVRNSVHSDENSIRRYFEQLLDCKYTLDLNLGSIPYLSDKNSQIVTNLIKAVEKNSQIIPNLSTSGGTSDGKHFAKFGIDVVEFGCCNDRIHKPNERVSIDEVKNLYNIYTDFLKNF